MTSLNITQHIYKSFLTIIILIAMVGNLQAQIQTGKPPMGWNSWDSYGKTVTEKAMLANIKVMADKLKPFGYRYFVVDAGWDINKDEHHQPTTVSIDEYGRCVPDTASFLNGLQPVIEAAHKAGLLFGIHIMRGIPRLAYEENLPVFQTTYKAKDIADTASVCRWNHDNYGVDMTKPGAQVYYDSYIALLAGWGIDFIKADDITGHPEEIKAVQLAIQKTGRKMMLSLSPGGDSKTDYLDQYKSATMLRITGDVWDNQKGIDKVFDAWKKWSDVDHDKLWLDMDMIPFGHLAMNNADPNYLHAATNEGDRGTKGKERLCSFTKDQQLTFITQRALGASPLFMGGDLPTTNDASFRLITNPDMLACNQNGVTGKLVYAADSIEVWRTPSARHDKEGWIGIFNRSGENRTVHLPVSDAGLQPCTLFDIWNNKSFGKTKVVNTVIAAHGVLFCRYGQ